MSFAANFTAIDFETANRRPDSACQLAAVTVRDGTIVDQSKWMIRPDPLHFSRTNIQIHGITPDQVRGEPVFGDLWPAISEKLTDDCLVAHNASFDIGVLLACLRASDREIPEFQFTCTRTIARRTWPHQRRYGLKPLATWLGIRFRHHDALEDSVACAKILLAAGIDREASSLPDLEKQLRLSRGRAGSWGHRGPSRRRTAPRRAARGRSGQPALPFLYPDQVAAPQAGAASQSIAAEIDLQRLMIRAEFIRPLSGMRVVFSGRLRSLTPQQAESLAARLGGTCRPAVDETTDYLVVGDGKTNDHDPAIALQQAREFRRGGKPIQIVNEDEFFGLVITSGN